MLYNQTSQSNGIPMPLLMGCTHPSQIKEAGNTTPIMYDPISQIVYNADRLVGTKSLESGTTRKKEVGRTIIDDKNVIDDSKWVN